MCVCERKKVSKRTSDQKIDWAIVWGPLRVREQPRKERISDPEGQLRRVAGELNGEQTRVVKNS